MKLNDIYKCTLCGNMIEVVFVGGGDLVCCGQPMNKIEEGVVEASKEKHIPEVERKADGFHVKVGSVEHPMEEKHYIQFIELIADGMSFKKYLKPGQKPQEVFYYPYMDKIKDKKAKVREYCNLHGLWSKEA